MLTENDITTIRLALESRVELMERQLHEARSRQDSILVDFYDLELRQAKATRDHFNSQF